MKLKKMISMKFNSTFFLLFFVNLIFAQNDKLNSYDLSICNEDGKLKTVVLENFLTLDFQNYQLKAFYNKDSSFYTKLDSNIFCLKAKNERFAIIKPSRNKITLICRDTSIEFSNITKGDKQDGIGVYFNRIDSFWIHCAYIDGRLASFALHYRNYPSSVFYSEFMTFGFLILDKEDSISFKNIYFKRSSFDLEKIGELSIDLSKNTPYSISIFNSQHSGLQFLDENFNQENANFNLIREKILVNPSPQLYKYRNLFRYKKNGTMIQEGSVNLKKCE